ncbi:hypothetical protein C8R43DRAFT_1114396 [Mycena crocata]|nr:hypothetical protein C8R43DRAFT_1114396 [Mycena crocata]
MPSCRRSHERRKVYQNGVLTIAILVLSILTLVVPLHAYIAPLLVRHVAKRSARADRNVQSQQAWAVLREDVQSAEWQNVLRYEIACSELKALKMRPCERQLHEGFFVEVDAGGRQSERAEVGENEEGLHRTCGETGAGVASVACDFKACESRVKAMGRKSFKDCWRWAAFDRDALEFPAGVGSDE